MPSVLELQEKGYGISKGIPTLIVASASCENVFAIAAFGIPLGIAFSGGKLTLRYGSVCLLGWLCGDNGWTIIE